MAGYDYPSEAPHRIRFRELPKLPPRRSFRMRTGPIPDVVFDNDLPDRADELRSSIGTLEDAKARLRGDL